MARRIIDSKLVAKLAKKLRKDEKAIGVMISRKAAKCGISSQAAQVVLAKEYGIAATVLQRKLDSAQQMEVRSALSASSGVQKVAVSIKKNNNKTAISKKASLKAATEYIIQDATLRSRCQPALLGKENFDVAVNQATQVLEDRIRKKAQPTNKMNGENLVGFAFKEEFSKTVLQVATNDPDDQRGYTYILRGVVPAFRNTTHHHLNDDLSREDAMRICGFIDVLLRIVDNAVKVR